MHLPLPDFLKRRLRATRQWLAISLPTPQQLIDVILVAGKEQFDVNDNNAVAALRPLTLRLGLTRRLKAALERMPQPRLHLVDRQSRRILGELRLKHLKDWSTAGVEIALFEVDRGTHYCAPKLRKVWDTVLYLRAARRVPPEKQLMSPAAVEQLMVFSLCPRPVYLVSVDDGERSNVFPMDLVGPLLPQRFTLALRNTSQSVETIKKARKVALAEVPGSACQMAYRLGEHHKKQSIDWQQLPFGLKRSKVFGLPVPDIALGVREIEILDFQTVGSHTFFVGRVASHEKLIEGRQLFHTSGIHQQLRRRLGSPFEEALGTQDR